MIEGTRNLVEAAGAAPLAAAVKLRDRLEGKRIALVCSGGNVTIPQLRDLSRHRAQHVGTAGLPGQLFALGLVRSTTK